jgi:hypothetical protein
MLLGGKVMTVWSKKFTIWSRQVYYGVRAKEAEPKILAA